MKTTILCTLVAIAVAAFLTFTALPAMSQDKPIDTMQLVLEKLRADKKLLVKENLQLTESEASAFWPVYNDYQKEIAKLEQRTRSLIEDYAGNYQNMSDAAAKKMLDEYISIQIERANLMKSYLPMFRKVLPEKKVAIYYQIENKINAGINYEFANNIPLVR